MSLPGLRFTMRRLMIVVALAGVNLAVARVDVFLGILVGLTSILALVRAFLATDRLRATGREVAADEGAALLIRSLGASLLLILVAASAFLAGGLVVMFLWINAGSHGRPPVGMAYVVGLLAAIGVVYRLRCLYWPPASLSQATGGHDPTPLRLLRARRPARGDRGVAWWRGRPYPKMREANQVERPEPRFRVGQPVRVILNERNRTPHVGAIREVVWHFKDGRYNYYLEESGRRVSKRYLDEDLESIHA
jgi:hypothetical protein